MSSPIRRVAASNAVPYANAHEHMLAELEWLKLVLHRQVMRLRAGGLLVENDFRGLYVPDEQVNAILNNPEAGAGKQILEGRDEIDERMDSSSSLPLARLRDSLNLSPFEMRALVACAAPEVDLAFEALFAYVQNDVNRKRPTADLMLKVFTGSLLARMENRAYFSSESALIDLGLIRPVESSDAQSSLAKGYRTEDRITDYLLGVQEIDGRLRSFASLSTQEVRLSDLLLPSSLKEDLASAAALFCGSGATFVLSGPDGIGKRSTAQALSYLSGRPLLLADMAKALVSTLPLSDVIRLLRREAMLQDANLFLGNCHHLLGEKGRIDLIEDLFPSPNFIVLATETPLAEFHFRTPALSFQLPPLPYEHRRQLWEKAVLETGVPCPDLDLRALSRKFALTGGQIYSACWSGFLCARLSKSSLTVARLEAAVREQSGSGLRRFAKKTETKQRWSDLVLPSRAMQQLHAVAASHSYRDAVYSEWGFGQKLALGKGLNVLFFGPSGTGKTMAASILANELGLDLYKIDLSSVLSKYIGETEKHLNQIFLEAHTSNAILLFDEADALFGKRSEVKDAHDRYANVETAYLLQKMEEYEGIVILTTNFRKNLDDAFARRMHHAVEFPFPDAANRQRIWSGLVPPNALFDDARFDNSVNFAFLARQFELSGGNIRNAMLAAAFLAAEESSPIRMDHLLLAAARELLKLGRLPSKSDFREYFDLIQAQL